MPPPQGTWNPIEGPGNYKMTSIIHNHTYGAIGPKKADFSGKTVFTNGASRGLGREMALSFAEAGASQIVISAHSELAQVVKDVKDAAADAGRSDPEVLSLKVDVSVPDSVNKASQEIDTKFGRLDVLVNNAAIMGQMD